MAKAIKKLIARIIDSCDEFFYQSLIGRKIDK